MLDNAQVTVLENATTAQYSHTLNVTGTDLSAVTVYGCSVSNNKPSSAKAIASNGINLMLKHSQMIYTLPMNCSHCFCHCIHVGITKSNKISISASESNIETRENVDLTCSATFEDISSRVEYVWSGPVMRNYASQPVLPLPNIQLSDAGLYMCTATVHNSSITAVISVTLQCKCNYTYIHKHL